jgi:hypothetical protein
MAYRINLIALATNFEAQLIDLGRPTADNVVTSKIADNADEALTLLWDIMDKMGIEEVPLVCVERGIVGEARR